jgi:hypothetical protein
VTGGERRLLKGYGPLLAAGVGFLLMALLVPTVAPDREVTVGAGPAGVPVAGGAGSTGLPASGASPVGRVPRAGVGTSGGAATAARSARAVAADRTGAPVGSGTAAGTPVGTVARCPGPQVPGDPYSPPCLSFSGSNGGATSRGVTATEIVVTDRIPAGNIETFDQAIQQIAGRYNSASFSDTASQLERTTEDLVTYFNRHFQFYGRHIVLKFFQGTGSLVTELTDAGQAHANADALTAADTYHAFADISALSQPYAAALSDQHVVNIGAPYLSLPWFEAHAPYAYSIFPDCTGLGSEAGAIATKQLALQPVSFAGSGVADGQPRRIATLAPDNPVYQECASEVTTALARAGHPAVANLSYTLDLSQLDVEAQSLAQQIVNDRITTVFCGCDPIMLVYLTGDLHSEGYEPEFFNIGAAFTDEDQIAQLFDQSVWAHAAGVTNNATTPPYGASLGYFAAKSVDPSAAPAHEVDQLYEILYVLALGIQMAGPDLTPATFAAGLCRYPGGAGQYGPWSFRVDGRCAFTPQHEFRYEWWDPAKTSPQDGQPGSYVVDPTWYSVGDVPNGPLPVFPNGPVSPPASS